MDELDRLIRADAKGIDLAVAEWRADLDLDARVAMAARLWESGVIPAQIAAAKLLTQARMRPDDAAWTLIRGWVPGFDDRASADPAMIAGQKRLVADMGRTADVAPWVEHDNPLARRAALIMTLPWAKKNHPSEADLALRDTVLDWAALLVRDRDHGVQIAIAEWLRALAKRDAPRVRQFLEAHGKAMIPTARAEITGALQER